MQITDTDISSNTAVGLDVLEEEVNNIFNVALQSTVSVKEEFDVDVETALNCGEGGGGGICLVLNQVPSRAFAQVVIRETSFEGNSARIGGG